MNDISNRVIALIAKAQNIDPARIKPESTFEEMGIDSVSAIGLAFDVETEFGIDFSDDEMFGLRSVGDIIQGVEKLVADKQAKADS